MNRAVSTFSGFTIIELMVALAIAAVMMMYAIPAFNDFTVQRQMSANVNAMVSALNYARSEAARLGADTTVQAIDASDSNDEWGPGFCVTQGDPGNCVASFRVFALDGAPTFDAQGALDNQDSLTFNSRGLLQGTLQGTIQLCGADADEDPGRVISINTIGRASVLDLTCFP